MSLKINNDTSNGSATLQPSNTPTGDVTHTLPAFTTELAPRMQLMTAQASTSGTYKDFTGIPSWAKKITVMFANLSTNGTSNPIIQLGTSSGFETSNYLGTAQYSAGNSTNYTTGILLMDATSVSASYLRQGKVELELLNENTWVVTGVTTNSGSPVACVTGGSKALSGILDKIRLTTVNGTDLFDSGIVNIRYEG